jgi:hypothetical protein
VPTFNRDRREAETLDHDALPDRLLEPAMANEDGVGIRRERC